MCMCSLINYYVFKLKANGSAAWSTDALLRKALLGNVAYYANNGSRDATMATSKH